MRARVPMNNKQKKQVHQEVERYYHQKGHELNRRTFKLFCVALNTEFGFGKKRLDRLIAAVSELSSQSKDDEVYWGHIDRRVIDQIGIEFERENYEEVDE